MARYTPAYSGFVRRLSEIDSLYRLAKEKESKDPIGLRHEIDALCRGAVVLLCAHLEAYIKELGEQVLEAIQKKSVARKKITPAFFYHISKDVIDDIKDTSSPESIANKVFSFISSDIDYWSYDGPFPRSVPNNRFNKGFSNPSYKKIRSYLNRFGYDQYKMDLARKLGPDYNTVENMVEQLVVTRNKIAHGDPSATKTPGDVKVMRDIIKLFCLSTDSVFSDWCKRNICSIR